MQNFGGSYSKKYKVVRLYLFVLLSLIFFSQFILAGSLSAFLGYSAFFSTQKGPYIETYLTVMGQTVVYKKKPNGKYQGTISITMLFRQNDTIKAVRKYNLHSLEIEDTLRGRVNFIDEQRFFMKEGIYDFELQIADKNSLLQPYKYSQKIEIRYDEQKMALSDIEFLESYSRSVTPTILTKNGYDLIPYVSEIYPKNLSRLSFYCEVYNAAKILGDSEKFVTFYTIKSVDSMKIISTTISDNVPKKAIADYRSFSKQKAAPINGILASFDITNLYSGNYNIFIEVKDKENNLLVSKSRNFKRENPIPLISSPYMGNSVKDGMIPASFAFRLRNRDSLNEFVNSLRPIAQASEKKIIDENLKDTGIELLQQFFFNFWKARNASNPEGEWNTYYADVRKVNKLFGSLNIKGYNADRGRVYLQYGEPYSRIPGDNSVGVYPYEIWKYNKIGNQTNVRFIFYDPDYSNNYFVLLHSDVRGEPNNEQWQAVLQKQNQLNGSPNNSYGNRVQEDFLNSK